ncbi:C40 family peptidase [Arthrobacter sp. H14-L1]|uniref:C40 family peptidase n=1 Tax=Arthrobacter sp. H14-L1 TaxID=2996697 RepID=UPI002271F840|nr:C40 family peptidase [Arthrobacter sp. H14-L1]MCY0906091.1 NlpC/P60 family protein [Arthrobacter sp. H14-L1]
MSTNTNTARHRATPVRHSSLKTISTTISSHRRLIVGPAAVMAVAYGLTFMGGTAANASGEVSPVAAANTSSSASTFGAGTYTVRSGDTLGAIAARTGVSLDTVFALNHLGWDSVIYPGQTLTLSGNAPRSASVGNSVAPMPAFTGSQYAGVGVGTASSGVYPILGSATSGIAGTARAYAGGRYVWGGSVPGGWDCSGFVQWVYAQHGINLPRTFQWNVMTPTGNPRPGDLVVQNGGSHVGIYLGNGQMISALNPSQGTIVHSVDAMPVMGYYTYNR